MESDSPRSVKLLQPLRYPALIAFWLFLGFYTLFYTLRHYVTIDDALQDKIKLFDFKIFYSSIYDFNKGGSLYKHSAVMPFDRDLSGNGNSPIAELIFLPLSSLPVNLAGALWLILSFCLICLGLGYFWQIQPFPQTRHWRTGMVLLFYISFPVVDSFQLGTWGLLIAFLEIMAWYCARKGLDGRAGVFLGLALIIRWPPFAIFLYFILIKRWRVILSALLTILGSCLLAFLAFGFDALKEYSSLIFTAAGGSLDAAYDGSLRAFLSRLANTLPATSSYLVPFVWVMLGLGLLGLALWRCRNLSFDYAYSLCIVTGLLLIPLSWLHYHVALLLPMLILAQSRRWPVIYTALLWLVPTALFPLGYNLDFGTNPLLFGSLLTFSLFILYYSLFRGPVYKPDTNGPISPVKADEHRQPFNNQAERPDQVIEATKADQ